MTSRRQELEAVRRILRDGGRIAFAPALGEPDLVSRLPDLVGKAPTEVIVPYRLRSTPLDGFGPHVSLRAWFGGGTIDGRDYSSGLFDRLPRVIEPGGPLPIDVALVRLSPPDKAGSHNVGPAASLTGELVRSAKNVIAEIDPEQPWTEGDTMVPGSLITLSVEAEGPLPLPPEKVAPVPFEADTRLANHVASLIPDGAYLQLGLGGTAQALVTGLMSHRRLRLHTGLISSEIQGLLESAAVDLDWLPRFGQAIGPASLMRYVDHNKRLSFHSTRYTHDIRLIAGYKRFYSVNSALAVDMFGRASSEGDVRRPRAGLGGLIDFLIAGRVAAEGANILALRSTTSSGVSRIVASLPSTEVSVPAYLVDYVVTEWGVADIRIATRQECAEKIVAIADSAHRTALEEDFRRIMRDGQK